MVKNLLMCVSFLVLLMPVRAPAKEIKPSDFYLRTETEVSLNRSFFSASLFLRTTAAGFMQAEKREESSSGTECSLELLGTFGAGQFYIDEGFPDHLLFGASIRFFLSNRVALEPEFYRLKSNIDYLPNEWRYTSGLNILWTFGKIRKGMHPSYVILGAGYRFGGNANNVLGPNIGFGVNVVLDKRLFMALEARLIDLRLSIGYRIKQKR